MRKSQSFWPGGGLYPCAGGQGPHAIPPGAPHPPLPGSLPWSCDSDSAAPAPARTCFFWGILAHPFAEAFLTQAGLPPPPLLRGGGSGGCGSRQPNSGSPISEAERGHCLPPPPPPCTFLGDFPPRPTAAIAGPGVRTPRRWAGGCGGHGWTRSSDFAPAAACWLQRAGRCGRGEPSAGLWLRWFDAHSSFLALSTCFYEMHHPGWWLRAPRPHPSGGEGAWAPAGHRRWHNVPVPMPGTVARNARWGRASGCAGRDHPGARTEHPQTAGCLFVGSHQTPPAALRGSGKGSLSPGCVLRAGGARGIAKRPGLIRVFPPSALPSSGAG